MCLTQAEPVTNDVAGTRLTRQGVHRSIRRDYAAGPVQYTLTVVQLGEAQEDMQIRTKE